MSDKNYKSPKLNKKGIFGDGSEPILFGAMITLISLIGLLGKGPVGSLLTFISIYLFGAYYFLLYAILLFFGVYLMVKRKIIRIQITMRLLGAIFVLLSCLIASSSIDTDLTISNFAKEYQNSIDLIKVGAYLELDVAEISTVGGGFFGYFLCALFNSTISKLGTTVVYVTLMILGLVLLLKDVVIYLIKFFASLKNKQSKRTLDNANRFTNNYNDLPKENINVEKKENLFANQIIEETNKVNKNKEEIKSPKEDKLFEEISQPKITKTSFFVDDLDDIYSKKTTDNSFSSSNVNPSYNRNEVDPNKSPLIDEQMKNTYKYAPFSELKEDVEIEDSTEEKKDIEPAISNSFFSSMDSSSNKEMNKKTKKEPLFESVEADDPMEFKNPSFSYSTSEVISPVEEEEVELEYIYPPINLLAEAREDMTSYENIQVADQRLRKINELFTQFNIGAQVISYNIGPSVTRFNIKMNPGVKVNTLSSIQNEVAIKLGGNKTVRLDLIVEGQETSALEVGNVKASPVSFRECFASIMNRPDEKLLVPLGKDISGNVVTMNIDELPHLLVAGTTGSGKSVFINTIITTLIMRNKPDELKLMLIDPKKVEFSKYNNLPHLLCPVITEANEGKVALGRLVDEMERRYSLFLEKGNGATKLSEYARQCKKYGYEVPPSIVMVCDEFSDFMTDNRKEIETYVKRLAQKARAAGIYLIICTQRPSVSVITGDIKAVVPSRIGLSVPSSIDSRTILDETGAESLLGNGDMLARLPRRNGLVRVQGSYISTDEIIDVCDYIRNQRKPVYNDNFLHLDDNIGLASSELRKGRDELHEKAKEHVMRTKIASTSNLQSAFGIGYARADHILYCLEEEGIVKRVNGNRRIVVKSLDDIE
ncbi:MAG: DNA translocase FtsK [Bacilli bacterium]